MQTAPYHADAARNDGGSAHWVTAADGVRLRIAVWRQEGAKGTVLMFPGRTEYAEKYGPAAADYAARGYASIAVDWRGQGLADRVHENRAVGHVGRFADYQLDVAAVIAHVRALGLPEPYYLLAHSMGGCIGLRALHRGLPVAAAACSAPMWGILMSSALRPLAWGLSTVSRPLGFSGQFAPGQGAETYVTKTTAAENTLTSDPEMFALLQYQLEQMPEVALGGPSLHWLNEALMEMRALARMPSPNYPCITFLGTEEAIVDPDRVKARMAAWPGGELVMLQGGRHEVVLERPELRNMVFDRSAALFEAQSSLAMPAATVSAP